MSHSFATPWTAAHQAPLSLGFSGEESWSGLPFPPPEDLPDPGIEPGSLALQSDSLPLRHQGSPIKHVFLLLFNEMQSSLPLVKPRL